MLHVQIFYWQPLGVENSTSLSVLTEGIRFIWVRLLQISEDDCTIKKCNLRTRSTADAGVMKLSLEMSLRINVPPSLLVPLLQEFTYPRRWLVAGMSAEGLIVARLAGATK